MRDYAECKTCERRFSVWHSEALEQGKYCSIACEEQAIQEATNDGDSTE